MSRRYWRGPAGDLSALVARAGGTVQISDGHAAPPARPWVAAVATTALESATTQPINLPAAQAGDLLVALYNGAAAAAYTLGLPAGFGTSLYDSTNGNLRGRGAAKVATGSDGATADVTMGGTAQRLTAVVFAIRDWDDSGAILDALAVSAAATGESTGPNPPNLTIPWGASVPSLALAIAHSAAGGSITYPASYTDGATGYTGVFNNFHARTSAAERDVDAAAEDPGAFAIGNSVLWMARTLAVKGTA